MSNLIHDGRLAQKVAARYIGLAGRVAARFVQAKASLKPAIQSLSKGEFDSELVRAALLAIEVRQNGDHWKIDGDWYGALGVRNQKRAKWVILGLAHLVNEPADAAVSPLGTLSHELKWLDTVISKADGGAFQHGAFAITPFGGVTRPQVEAALLALDNAAKVIRPKFPKLLYGKVYVTKTLPTSHTGTVAQYMQDGDIVYLSTKAKKTRGDVYALCHEFGHRYFHKFWKDKGQQHEFMMLSTTPEYGKTVFDEKARQQIVKEYFEMIEAKKTGDSRPPSEMFSTWIDHQMGKPEGAQVRSLGTRFLGGDTTVEKELRGLVLGKDFTVTTRQAVRPALHVTPYGGTKWTENFAEAFAHFVLGMPMPAEIAALMAAL